MWHSAVHNVNQHRHSVEMGAHEVCRPAPPAELARSVLALGLRRHRPAVGGAGPNV